MIDTSEVAAAVAEADNGEPAARWAVMSEIALVAGGEGFECPGVSFFNFDGRPGLSLCLETADGMRAWIRWFGRTPVVRNGWFDWERSITWRGYRVNLHGPKVSA